MTDPLPSRLPVSSSPSIPHYSVFFCKSISAAATAVESKKFDRPWRLLKSSPKKRKEKKTPTIIFYCQNMGKSAVALAQRHKEGNNTRLYKERSEGNLFKMWADEKILDLCKPVQKREPGRHNLFTLWMHLDTAKMFPSKTGPRGFASNPVKAFYKAAFSCHNVTFAWCFRQHTLYPTNCFQQPEHFTSSKGQCYDYCKR